MSQGDRQAFYDQHREHGVSVEGDGLVCACGATWPRQAEAEAELSVKPPEAGYEAEA